MSFGDLVDRVLADRPRLELRATVDDEAMAALQSFFAAHNVAIERRPDAGGPTAALVRDGETVATADLEDLVAYVTMDGMTAAPALVEAVSTETVALPVADRSRLLRSSRQIESRAWRAGGGRLDACLQRFSRFRSHSPTEQLYRRLGAAGVDVHLVGEPDAAVDPSPGLTVHERESVGDTWFVAYRGETRGALLAQERAPNRYSGFWTFEADLVADVIAEVDRLLA